MQLVIQNGKVAATHDDGLNIAGAYPGCEIIQGDIQTPLAHRDDGTTVPQRDPRTNVEKVNYYSQARALEYPSIQDQLDMMYWDAINKTNTWADAIGAIKTKYPKPSKEVLDAATNADLVNQVPTPLEEM